MRYKFYISVVGRSISRAAEGHGVVGAGTFCTNATGNLQPTVKLTSD